MMHPETVHRSSKVLLTVSSFGEGLRRVATQRGPLVYIILHPSHNRQFTALGHSAATVGAPVPDPDVPHLRLGRHGPFAGTIFECH